MANNKDFIVKNAVEVGGPTKVTLGTITSSNIDLSTGNYFSDTLAANTTYTISNAGDVQSFQLEVTGGAVGYWEVSEAVYTGISLSVASQETNPQDIFVGNEGTELYIVGSQQDNVNQYTLTTAWDLSTASYTRNFSVFSQDPTPLGLSFSSDGMTMYMLGNSNSKLFTYDLSTAWNISTASYNSAKDFSGLTSQTPGPDAVAFKSDGTKMYVTGTTAPVRVSEYTLSNAWDPSTATYSSQINVSGQQVPGGSFRGITFKPDGTKMYLTSADSNLPKVLQYTLSTAWSISSASYDGDPSSFDFSSEESAGRAVALKSNGSKMFLVGILNDTVYEYSIGAEATLTWPSSIEWAGGIAPAAPAAGETDVFTISTDDGGTSYVGVKTADNLS